MRFDWDPHKDAANRRKHGLSFEEASELFTSGAEYLEIFDAAHSTTEDRFIAIGLIARGVIVEQTGETIRIISARSATRGEASSYRRHMERKS